VAWPAGLSCSDRARRVQLLFLPQIVEADSKVDGVVLIGIPEEP